MNLRAEPHISQFLEKGFEYIYIDEDWWNSLDQTGQEELSQPCIQEVASVKNTENGILRRLIRISHCQ